MKHEEAKEILFNQDTNLKEEYDALQPIYEIRRQLIQYRTDLGLSQQELANMVGTKQSSISRLESGDYNPSIEFLNKVANALGKKVRIMIQ